MLQLPLDNRAPAPRNSCCTFARALWRVRTRPCLQQAPSPVFGPRTRRTAAASSCACARAHRIRRSFLTKGLVRCLGDLCCGWRVAHVQSTESRRSPSIVAPALVKNFIGCVGRPRHHTRRANALQLCMRALLDCAHTLHLFARAPSRGRRRAHYERRGPATTQHAPLPPELHP